MIECQYFNSCGGCMSQHIDYSTQLENKKKLLSHILGYGEISVVHGEPYGYRNRMDFHFHQNGLGFRKKGQWNSLIDIERCAISNARLNSILTELRAYFKNNDAIDPKKNTGTLRYAVVRTPSGASSISFVLNENSTRLGEAIERIRDYAKSSSADNIVVTYVESDDSISQNFFIVKGEDMLSETFLGKNFRYSVQGFFQNNSQMAEKMLKHVNDILKGYDTRKAHLLDLYGGVGTFGIVNSDLFSSVCIVENFKQSIDAAQLNIKENGIKNARALVLDAKNLRKANLASPLFVIADPPRTGMDPKAILSLRELEPEVIVYISCNPQQLGKEIPKFKNYEIRSATLFDLFPQTNHMEVVVELAKLSLM